MGHLFIHIGLVKSMLTEKKSYNYPIIANIEKVIVESPKVKTFVLNIPQVASIAKPGQFLMVWVIGYEEIPISISKSNPESGELWLTVARVGTTTEYMHTLSSGDLLGIKGPYGNGFSITPGNIILVGGGYGIAPLSFAAEELAKKEAVITTIVGARTESELIFINRLKKIAQNTLYITTDDGTAGFKGTTVDQLAILLEKDVSFDRCLVCGPELMIKSTWKLCKQYDIPVEASLERYMKCGFGLCGSCMIGPYRVCKDGPVFTDSMLEKVSSELGIFKRDSSGMKVHF